MSLEGTQPGGFGRRGAPSPSNRSRSLPSSGGADGTQVNLVLAFIGENIDRFRATVEAMARKSDTLSIPVVGWCWPAFFFSYLWLAYRRMYAAALGAYLVELGLILVPLPLSRAPYAILLGLLGKAFYVTLAARQVRSILDEERNPTAAVISVRARGGTSWGAVWAALCLSAGLTLLLVLAVLGFLFSDPDAPRQIKKIVEAFG